MQLRMVAAVFAFCCGGVSVSSAGGDVTRDLEYLRQLGEASISFCQMRMQIASMENQVARGADLTGATAQETARRTCAKEMESSADFTKALADAKADLVGKDSALLLLKDWYGTWLGFIENIPLNLGDSDADTTVLDVKMAKVRTELAW